MAALTFSCCKVVNLPNVGTGTVNNSCLVLQITLALKQEDTPVSSSDSMSWPEDQTSYLMLQQINHVPASQSLNDTLEIQSIQAKFSCYFLTYKTKIMISILLKCWEYKREHTHSAWHTAGSQLFVVLILITFCFVLLQYDFYIIFILTVHATFFR